MTAPVRAKIQAANGSSLVSRLQPLPAGKGAARQLFEILSAAKMSGLGEEFADLMAAHPALQDVLGAAAEASPFLAGLMREDPARLANILKTAPEARLASILSALKTLPADLDEAALMQSLRRARAELALLVALADLGGAFDLAAVMAALTAFADAAVRAAVAFLLRREADAGRLRLAYPADPARASGFIVLAMGKHGAGELNYSSDIDLIVLFDADKAPVAEGIEPSVLFVRLAQRLVRLLQERTEDGYVFRCDLRLRPDPGSTSLALSTEAALRYYESRGQNWERAALIKARAVAGDLMAGEAFLAALVPYVWRKYLDYAAIADIHSIKRQIHDFRGHETVAVAGHNIKLGRGGIREIEFFVQTQQLIAGGRNPRLRGRQTLGMLAALADAGWIDAKAAKAMAEAYVFLRTIEHRLQMIADEQTHTLPAAAEPLLAVAHLAGYRSIAAFAKAMTGTLTAVEGHYARLFEAAPSLATAGGSLVFTGTVDDPETLATLARIGFARPAAIAETIRGWHFGRYRAMQSSAARERLTEFLPALLAAFAATGDADAAFLGFDRFLERLPSGVQLFSLLASNPDLLSLLAAIMASAPRLAELVIRRPHVLDQLIDPAFAGGLADASELATRLAGVLGDAGRIEAALDRARIFGQEQSFLIGAQLLSGAVAAEPAGVAYADLADTLARALADCVMGEFIRAHGRMKAGRFAVVALGKWGGREMTAASDLDVMTIYDFDERATVSDGPRPLAGSQYYARLTQRLIAALSAPTAEGGLYAVDMRLRPSGSSGPLAVSLGAFAAYQAKEAWTWEHMALTRLRVVAGDESLAAEVTAIARRVLTAPRDAAKTRADVLEMRGLIETEKGGGGVWDLKQAPGGLVDIEFVAQFLALTSGKPDLLASDTGEILRAARRLKVLPPDSAETLISALRLYRSLNAITKLSIEERFAPERAPKPLLALLSRAAALPDFGTLEAHVRDTEEAVRALFARLIGAVPAAAPDARGRAGASGAMQNRGD